MDELLLNGEPRAKAAHDDGRRKQRNWTVSQYLINKARSGPAPTAKGVINFYDSGYDDG